MRLNLYNVKINRETNRTELIKEKAVNYSAYKKLQSPEHIVEAVNSLLDLQNMAEEYAYLLTLNMIGATAIIFVHNHPSGYPEPSHEDIRITERIKKAGELIGIELLDHIIIGDKCFISFRKEEILAKL